MSQTAPNFTPRLSEHHSLRRVLARLAGRYALYVVILAMMLAFLVWPIILTVAGGFVSTKVVDGKVVHGVTLAHIWGVFEDPLLVRGLINALMLGICSTVLCLAVTLPLSMLSVKYEFFAKRWLGALMLVPLILPPFVGAIGVRAIFGRFGAVNQLLMWLGILDPAHPGIDFIGGDVVGGQFLAIVVMNVLHLYPIMYLNLTAALANLDPAMDEAAVNLGASRARRFFGITLPLIVPGIFAGATIVFISAFTELGTPLMFDYYNVTAVQVYWGIQEIDSSPRPYALVIVMLAIAVMAYVAAKVFIGGRGYAMQSKAAVAAVAKPLTGWKSLAAAGAFALLIGVALLPHIGVVLSSFSVDGSWYRSILPKVFTTEHYTGALTHPLAMDSIRNSLIYASIAMVICVAIGLAISYLNARVKLFGAGLLDAMAMLPLAVPGLVMAFGYVAMSVNWPFPQVAAWLSAKGMPGLAAMLQVRGVMPNPILFLVIAYAIRRLPYVVRSVSAGLEQTSGALEEAARNLGAGPLYAIRRVVLPLILANIIAGAILAFSFSMLEVSDSLILAQRDNDYPITKAIFVFYGRLGDGPYIASAMGVWAMVLLTVTLVGAGLIMGKRMGAIFRA
jgi:iron(III) transport system permease protein